jgi:hypothetical protein
MLKSYLHSVSTYCCHDIWYRSPLNFVGLLVEEILKEDINLEISAQE